MQTFVGALTNFVLVLSSLPHGQPQRPFVGAARQRNGAPLGRRLLRCSPGSLLGVLSDAFKGRVWRFGFRRFPVLGLLRLRVLSWVLSGVLYGIR